MKIEPGTKMAEIATLKPETFSYLTGNNDESKTAKSRTKFVIKQIFKLED